MDMNLDFREIPFDWVVCYVSECPRKQECMRYQVCQRMPKGGMTVSSCVLPLVLQQERCPHFHPILKVRAAVGFSRIFDEVKARHHAPMRSELAAYLGGGGTYYRYRSGKRLLMPEQQEWISQLFRRYGYTDEVVFDGYRDIYRFDI